MKLVPAISLFLVVIPAVCAARTTTSSAEISGATGNSIEMVFDSPATRTLQYGPAGQEQWRTLTDVQETTYNLINLQPQTRFEVRFSRLENSTTESVTGITVGLEPLTTGGLKIGPFHQLHTFPDNVWYPTIEYHHESLWLVESYKGQLHLSRMDAATSKVVSTQVVVDQPHAGRETYLGIMDSVIHDGKLWIMYNEQDTNVPGGYHIKMSRQKVFSYDLATGDVTKPLTMEPVRPESGTWEGGIDVLNGKLWTVALDVWLENGKRRTNLVMRTFDGEKFGEPIIYEDCPTEYPYGPSISPYGDKLIVLFSDLIPYETDKNREPLYFATFDGKRFSAARKIMDRGRNRYAKGVKLGDKFVMGWKSNADWWERFGHKYHDISVGTLKPETGELQVFPAVADRKYNSSPDLTLVSPEHAVMVFGKFEHEYMRADPAFNHGAYIGDILLDRAASEE